MRGAPYLSAMKIIKNENVLAVSDAELADLKQALYTAAKTNEELAKLPDARTEGRGSAKETAARYWDMYEQL